MVGGTALNGKLNNPSDGWLTERQWAIIQELSLTITSYKGIDQDFIQNIHKWKAVYLSQEPYNCPEWPWAQSLNSFQKLLLVIIIRPDKFIPGV